MAEQAITQPNARTYGVDDLVTEVLAGRVRIPDFQRPLRWGWEDVRRLFDSIVRGYPIGSLLLWARPAKAAALRLGALAIDAPPFDEALWVVDGQQRLTSLASALSDAGMGDPRFAVAYDLRGKKFERPDAGEAFRLPLPVLFDLQRLLKWFADHPEAGEHLNEATRITKAIRQYTVPAYIVKQDDEGVLRDIFDRMNNYGKRLSRAEVFTALHSGKRASDLPRTLSDISGHLDTHFGFGPLDEDTVLRAFLARRGADVTREIRVEFGSERVSREFPGETAEDANRGTEAALERVVAFLQEDAGVPHFGFLPYRYLLVVLTRFFAHYPDPVPRNRELLRRWFWKAAIVGPRLTRGAYTSTVRTLAGYIRPDNEGGSVTALLDAVSGDSPSFSLPRKFKSTHAEVRFVLCALWSLHPRSVLTGMPYERSELTEALAGKRTASDALEVIFRSSPESRTRTSNRVILLGDDGIDEARDRFAQRGLDLAKETWLQVLESHALTPELSQLLQADEMEAFLSERDDLIQRVTRSFLERMTESAFEDTPPLEDLDLDDEGEVPEDGVV